MKFTQIIKFWIFFISLRWLKTKVLMSFDLNSTICQMWLQIMECPLILLRFFWEFSYIINEHSCLKYFIFTKHSQIVYLMNVYILVCQHAKYDCRLWKALWFNRFLGNFQLLLHIWNVITSSNFYKLCVKAEVKGP